MVLTRIDERVHFDWADGSPDPKIKPDRFSVRWTGKLVAPKTGACRIGVDPAPADRVA